MTDDVTNLPARRSSHYEDVREFSEKFGLPLPSWPSIPPGDMIRFRASFMLEELNEFIAASEQADLAGMADALVDMVYVAIGTAQIMGLPWQSLWDEVQRTNMMKERVASADDSKRGSAWDVKKPPGWTAPRIHEILSQS